MLLLWTVGVALAGGPTAQGGAISPPIFDELPSKPEPPRAADWAGRWVVEWARPRWKPYLFTGTLELKQDGEAWTATLAFKETVGAFTPTRAQVDADSARLAFDVSGATLEIEAMRDGDDVRGRARWLDATGATKLDWSAFDGARAWDALIKPGVASAFLPTTPAQAGLDEAALRALVSEAQRTHSSGFVLLRDGRLVVAVGEAPSKPAHVASVSKALSSLAVPYLLAEGKWPSLDQPIGPALGAWGGDDPRGAITLRHVLSHTTGLEKPDYAEWIKLARQDHRADVLAAPLVRPPGAAFEYNNRSVELLSDLVAATTGEALDAWLKPRLLDPLRIDAEWWHDPAGHARVHAGVDISALDLAKIGQLLLDDGRWEGRQVLPKGWTATATAAPALPTSEAAGLGWMLLSDGRGFQHTGDSGAMLMVLPKERIVAARVHLPTRPDEDQRLRQHSLGALMKMVLDLDVR